MKFLVIGLGSMGKRRIRCLLELGIEKGDILGYDINPERRQEVNEMYIITTPKLSIPLYKKCILLVCTPPDKHLQYQQIASDYKISCFTEASVCLSELYTYQNPYFIFPSATMRFNKDVKFIKKQMFKPRNFIYRCSSYLPDWHPNEDINDFYVSKKETGACREIVPFELEWLIWIFGEVKTIKGIISNTGEFGEIDTSYHILIEFVSGIVGYVLIDITDKDAKGGERLFSFKKDGLNLTIPINIKESMYVEEIRHFIESVEGKEYHYTLRDDIKILKLLEEVEK